MERLDHTKELDRLTPLMLGKMAHLEDMAGVALPEAEQLSEDSQRTRKSAGLGLDVD